MINTICIVGAGTMGSGIAMVGAQSGIPVLLFDISMAGLEKGKASIQKNLQWMAEKKKITAAEKDNIFQRISFINDINDCVADLIIEAIIEKTEAKVDLFNQLAKINSPNTIFATNTSSLSVSAIQAHVVNAERVVGMHFFNPAQVMKLVEVVKGDQTGDDVAQTIFELCAQMKKTAVMCSDAPGFIVNRVARHYYLEAMNIVQSGIATIENVDEVMEACGFKMGPFKLMDLIGLDINFAVSESLYKAFNGIERFKPSTIQQDKVAKGELGKKSGRGFYEYK